MTAELLAGIRAIYLDAVGTVLAPDPPALTAYAAVAQRYGVSVQADLLRPRFMAAFNAEEELDRRQSWKTSEDREYDRWRRIVSHVFDFDDPAIFADLWRHFASPAAWALLPGAAETLRRISGRKLRLGVASNLDHRLHAILAGFPECQLLHDRVVSSEVGWRKPAREFFDAVVRSAGCAAEEILFVGDDRVNDYEGARACGLRAVLFDSTAQAGSDVRIVRELKELTGSI